MRWAQRNSGEGEGEEEGEEERESSLSAILAGPPQCSLTCPVVHFGRLGIWSGWNERPLSTESRSTASESRRRLQQRAAATELPAPSPYKWPGIGSVA